MSQWHFFVGESSIVALYSNIFEKLGKVRWKIKTYVLIFQNQTKDYQEDKCSIQGGLYKAWYI
jgi:hypothetical protein